MNAGGRLYVANGGSRSILAFAQGCERQREAGRLDHRQQLPASSQSRLRSRSIPHEPACSSPTRARHPRLRQRRERERRAGCPDHRRLSYPAGVIADAKGHIYAADVSVNDTIKEFARSANGNATPLRTIEGPNTTLDGPNSLAH